MNRKNFEELQLEALTIRYFIIEYDRLEKEVKRRFYENLDKVSDKKKQMLYFYLAGIKTNSVSINYGIKQLEPSKAKFSEEEKFTMFSLSQILGIQREEQIIDFFDFTIPSINQKSTEYIFCDCCTKLLRMRNKLAHEMADLSFSDKEIIEVLSNEYIREHSSEWFSMLDVQKMNDETKSMFSNFIMMKAILKILQEKESSTC